VRDRIEKEVSKMFRLAVGLGLAVTMGTIAVAASANSAGVGSGERISLASQELTPIWGRTIAKIDDNNIDKLAFSPDDRFLAYSAFVAERDSTKRVVRIFDLRLQKVVKTISAADINDNEDLEIKWQQANRLIVRIVDGDTTVVNLTFNPHTGQQISRTTESSSLPDLSPALIATWQREIIALAPRIDRVALKDALENRNRQNEFQNKRIIVGDKAIILGRLFDGEYNIWSFDLTRKIVRKIPSVRGRITEKNHLVPARQMPNDRIFFTVHGHDDPNSSGYVYQNGAFQEMREYSTLASGSTFKVLRSTPQRTILFGYPDGDDGENTRSIYTWENGRLLASQNATRVLHEASISNSGNWIALCAETPNGKRQIAVKELLRR
jgi:hypothetical protein